MADATVEHVNKFSGIRVYCEVNNRKRSIQSENRSGLRKELLKSMGLGKFCCIFKDT